MVMTVGHHLYHLHPALHVGDTAAAIAGYPLAARRLVSHYLSWPPDCCLFPAAIAAAIHGQDTKT